MDAAEVDWGLHAIAAELGQSLTEIRQTWTLDEVEEALRFIDARAEIRRIYEER